MTHGVREERSKSFPFWWKTFFFQSYDAWKIGENSLSFHRTQFFSRSLVSITGELFYSIIDRFSIWFPLLFRLLGNSMSKKYNPIVSFMRFYSFFPSWVPFRPVNSLIYFLDKLLADSGDSGELSHEVLKYFWLVFIKER